MGHSARSEIDGSPGFNELCCTATMLFVWRGPKAACLGSFSSKTKLTVLQESAL